MGGAQPWHRYILQGRFSKSNWIQQSSIEFLDCDTGYIEFSTGFSIYAYELIQENIERAALGCWECESTIRALSLQCCWSRTARVFKRARRELTRDTPISYRYQTASNHIDLINLFDNCTTHRAPEVWIPHLEREMVHLMREVPTQICKSKLRRWIGTSKMRVLIIATIISTCLIL